MVVWVEGPPRESEYSESEVRVMSECKVPRMANRTRSEYLTDYREFDMAVGSRFNKSYSYDVSSVLHKHDLMAPGAAFCCEDMRIIDDLKFFPGSPMYFAKLLEWAWETKRAYKDAYYDTDDVELESALCVCVEELEEFFKLVMLHA